MRKVTMGPVDEVARQLRPRRRSLPLRLYDLLHEPRVITALMIVTYSVVLTIGLSAWIDPPVVLEHELGWVGQLWPSTFIIGGVVGIVAAPRGLWWLERAALNALYPAT